MDVAQLFEDFRIRHPEMATATDAKHAEIWGNTESDSKALWFESLAGVLNTQMGNPERHAEIEAIFTYFDREFRTGTDDVRKCIDVCLVENLFWQVGETTAAPVWAALPKTLQQVYVDFHGRAPSLG